MYKRILPIIAAMLIVSLSVALVSCGGDDDDGGTSTAEPTSASTSLDDQTPDTTASGPTDAPTSSTGETPGAPTTASTPAEGATTVNVNLTEYVVSPNPASAPAGPVTFVAKNIGGTEHELVVIRTDLAPESLPTNADGSVDEEGAGMEAVGELEGIPLQEEREMTSELTAGNYVLICNVVQTSDSGEVTAHYAEGMYSAFTVQ